MGPLSAVLDPQFRRDIGRGLVNTAGYGIASMAGTPADLAAVLGYQTTENGHPKFGTEWFRQQLEGQGLVGPERNPWAEGLASLLSPLAFPNAGIKAVKAVSKTTDSVEEMKKLIELLRQGRNAP